LTARKSQGDVGHGRGTGASGGGAYTFVVALSMGSDAWYGGAWVHAEKF